MTLDERFERSVAAWLVDRAGEAEPGYLGEVLARTEGTRQRPAWSSLGRWFPVDTTLRLTPVPRLAWLLVALALLVAAAVVVALIGSRPRLPAPFGPAGNGSIVYAANGNIELYDPATNASRAIVGGPEADVGPSFSHDGTRLVFGRQTGVEQWALMVANADGTGVRRVAPSVVWATWSPDDSRLAVIDELEPGFSIVALDGSPTVSVALDMMVESVQWRPSGQELIFRRVPAESETGLFGLYVVKSDGSGLRPIAPPTDNDGHWQNPALSPDGNQIAYTAWAGDGRLFLIDVATGDIDALMFSGASGSDYFATWSPDGTQLVFNRGNAQVSHHLSIGPATGGDVVDIGPLRPWEPAAYADFSPDGTQVIARYDDGSAWLFPISGGPGKQLPDSEMFLGSWQRLAP